MRNSTPVFTFICTFWCALVMAQSPVGAAATDSFDANLTANASSDRTSFEGTVDVKSSNTLNTQTDFTINPNPIEERATILYRSKTNTDQLLNVSVYNVLGQEVRRFKLKNNVPYIFERDKLKSGIYMIQVAGESKIVAATKMVIR